MPPADAGRRAKIKTAWESGFFVRAKRNFYKFEKGC
jgi:hypothetical protein